MQGFKRLTLKEIKKRHAKNPQDKKLHQILEKETITKKTFNKLIEESTKKKPFDKKKRGI